jgi:signal transduction histidine kinase
MGKFRNIHSAPMLAVAILLFALLALLATLQYRWLNRVSEADREQRRSALQASATRFCEDFDRELARAYVAFLMDAETIREKAWAHYAERYARWKAQSPHPGLIGNLFLLAADGKNSLSVNQFDAASGRFVERDWPAQLQGLRQRMEDQRRDFFLGTGVVAPMMPPPLAGDIPALIIPVLFIGRVEMARPLRTLPPPRPPAFFGCVVAELDLNYIRQKFIPVLAAHYFASQPGGELDYQLSILNRALPQTPIYTSQPSVPNVKKSFDEVKDLFSLRLNLVEDFSFDIALPAPVPPGFAVRGERGATTVMGPAVAGASVGGTAGAFFFSSNDVGLWELRLQHRAGSLEEVVAQVRRRNLIVGFGILLLLAGSVALIYLSAQRERRLARQQLEFVAGVSHELRVPVSVVCMTSANLADGLVREPEKVRQYGALLQNAGRRLADSIEQVLDFTGAEMLKRPYHLAPVATEAVIEQALTASKPNLSAAGFQLKMDIAEALPPINADRLALERALQNLLSNAMKYSNGSRLIEIRALAQSNKRGEEVQITVADRGIGIEPEELSELFEPFKRGAAAVAAQIPGNGLGLYLVKRIVAAHGGSISVNSEPGVGSTFTIHLPALTDQQQYQN